MVSKFKKNNFKYLNLNQNFAPKKDLNLINSNQESNGFISQNDSNQEMEIDTEAKDSNQNSIIMNEENDAKKFKIVTDSFYGIDNSYLENYSTANSNNEIEKKLNNSTQAIKEYKESPKKIEQNISTENPKDNEIELNFDSNYKNEEEYLNEIIENLKIEEKENKFKINRDYFNSQTEINYKMRIILIDWVLGVNIKLKFKEETFYTTIYIIDAYLSKKFIKRKNFQLLGVTALFISAKLNELFAGKIKDYLFITDYAYEENDIILMEKDITKTLKFNFLVPTCLSFFQIFCKKIGFENDSNEAQFGQFLIRNFLLSSKSFNYNYSRISISSIYILWKIFCVENNKSKFCIFFKDDIPFIEECSKNICIAIKEIIDLNIDLSIKKYYYGYYINCIKKINSLYNI